MEKAHKTHIMNPAFFFFFFFHRFNQDHSMPNLIWNYKVSSEHKEFVVSAIDF